MLNQITSSLLRCIAECWSWFDQFMDAIPGILHLIIGMFVVFLSYRFFLVPLIHGDVLSMASDRVARIRNREDPIGHINGRPFYKNDVKIHRDVSHSYWRVK